jgi:hypothetical protein
MGDGDGTGITVDPYPHPMSPPRALSLAFAAGAAIAGFLGFCLWAAILATLSLVFNLWDLFQGPKRTVATTTATTPTPGGPVTTRPPEDRGGPGGPASA